MIRCAICFTKVFDGEPEHRCEACEQVHHAACWDDIGGCGTYGCTQAAVAEKPAPPQQTSGGWGDSKDCPACGDAIHSSRLACSCGARFPYADPMTRSDYQAWLARTRAAASVRRWLTVLFIATLTGVLAPIAGPVAGLLAHARRELLAGEHGTFLALGYGSAAISALYAVVGVLLLLGL